MASEKKELSIESIATAHKRKLSSARKMSFHTVATAAECIGELEHDCEIFCLTRGQFSLFNVIEHILDTTGPAHVVIATWTAQGADTQKAKEFLVNGALKSLRWIVDASFISRQPEYCETLIREFGDCIRSIRTHAKFVIIGNENWHFVVRTSMNFNKNIRCEDVEITESKEFYDYFLKFTDEVFTKFDSGEWRRDRDYDDRLTGWDDGNASGIEVSKPDSQSFSSKMLKIKEEKERCELELMQGRIETEKIKRDQLAGKLAERSRVTKVLGYVKNVCCSECRERVENTIARNPF